MSSSIDAGIVEAYRFTPNDLRVDARLPGINAFMRIRNGAYNDNRAIETSRTWRT